MVREKNILILDASIVAVMDFLLIGLPADEDTEIEQSITPGIVSYKATTYAMTPPGTIF